MRKTHVFGLALFVVFAFSAVVAAMASAETTLPAQWLVGGVAVLTELLVEVPGEILLEDTKTIAGKVAVLCSGILDGWIGAEGTDLITEVLSLSLVLIQPNLVGTGLLCSAETVCEAASEASPIEVWPEELPWPTLLFLMEDGKILLLVELAAYDVLCLTLGIMIEDLCSSADSEFEVMNEPTAEILAGELALPLGTCTEGGVESGVNETEVLAPINLVEGGELTVSSE